MRRLSDGRITGSNTVDGQPPSDTRWGDDQEGKGQRKRLRALRLSGVPAWREGRRCSGPGGSRRDREREEGGRGDQRCGGEGQLLMLERPVNVPLVRGGVVVVLVAVGVLRAMEQRRQHEAEREEHQPQPRAVSSVCRGHHAKGDLPESATTWIEGALRCAAMRPVSPVTEVLNPVAATNVVEAHRHVVLIGGRAGAPSPAARAHHGSASGAGPSGPSRHARRAGRFRASASRPSSSSALNAGRGTAHS